MMIRMVRTPPTFTPTVEARWFLRSPILPQVHQSNYAMCISRSPAWRICFCTTPAGVCANELEDLSGPTGSRCSCRSPEFHSLAAADLFAADDVRVYFRPRHGEQRVYASGIQESFVAGDNCDQHGVHRRLVRCDAVDCRVSVHSRD